MSSLEEKEMEKEIEMVKNICIGDNNGNNHRKWCSDLPMDALLLIMNKVGAIYILKDAQWVCKNWRKVCREVPSLWRNIDMTSLECKRDDIDLNMMAREAIDRAHGDVQQFYTYYFKDDSLLLYLAGSTSLLRHLRLISYGITEKGLAESLCRFPLLEEIDIIFGSCGDKVLESVGTTCPHLKCFRYNRTRYRRYTRYESDDEALVIANYMPNVRQLQIVGNYLTNIGLMEILDRCVHLESLDLRCCFKINMDATTLRAKCARIRDLRLPDDTLDDYEFRAEAEMDDSPDHHDIFFDHLGVSMFDMTMLYWPPKFEFDTSIFDSDYSDDSYSDSFN